MGLMIHIYHSVLKSGTVLQDDGFCMVQYSSSMSNRGTVSDSVGVNGWWWSSVGIRGLSLRRDNICPH